MAELGRLDLNSGQKGGLVFGGAFLLAGIAISTIIFPFWNLIREDVFEDVVILTNDDGVCYVETSDLIPKTIENCDSNPGETVSIKFGKGLAWATIMS
jgi:hypothetical protein